jgi:Uma2 family endonuclease
MATALPMPAPDTLTYDAYLAEGEINRRYDIVDGVRILMPAPDWPHQEILLNIAELLRAYQRTRGTGRVAVAPLDVLIRRAPRLQVRQPDVLFISNETLAQSGGIPHKGPLEVGPELVVEILSDSDTEQILGEKRADYRAIGIREAWLVNRDTRTVEVLRLTSEGPTPDAAYDETQTLASFAFPDLTLTVAEIFKV